MSHAEIVFPHIVIIIMSLLYIWKHAYSMYYSLHGFTTSKEQLIEDRVG